MSREGVAKFITRVMEDENFRTAVKANPDAALAQFDLTADELSAIKSADRSKLAELGIDDRVSKLAVGPTTIVPQGQQESVIGWLINLFSQTSGSGYTP